MKLDNLNLTFQKELENKFLNVNVPNIRVGDTIKLGVSITEGNKERVQFTEGVVIAKKNSALKKKKFYVVHLCLSMQTTT